MKNLSLWDWMYVILMILFGLIILLAFPQYAKSWLMPFNVASGFIAIGFGIKRIRVRQKSQEEIL